jgi:hypothetical protein
MKYALAAMCALTAIFMGGCSVWFLASSPLALVPVVIAALNLAIIGSIFGWMRPWPIAFFFLAGIDIICALTCAVLAGGFSSAPVPWLYVIAAVFALKGISTFIYGVKTGER